MRTNLSEETLELLTVAKKASICMMDPVLKEELVFRAIIDMQHPLWIIIKNKFGIGEPAIKALIYGDIVKNLSDDPAKPENLEKLKKYFDIANAEAKRDGSLFIEPIHLLRAVFLSKDNLIIKIFKDMGIHIEDVVECLEKVSYPDLIRAIQKDRSRKPHAASMQAHRTTEQYYFGLQSDSQIGQYGRNLTAIAREGKLDAVYFRDEEIATTIEILCRKQQNNPLLIGEAGVGKTAIVEGIAQRIVDGKVPLSIKDSEIIELSITSLVAGTTLRGQFEERIQRVIDECAKNPNIILFIDEIHMIVGAGGEKGLSDAANIFKPALARGGLRCIGATTTKENSQFMEKDKALKRRFQPVFVKEPTPAQTVNILNKCKDRFEKFHGVKIPEETVKTAVDYANRYVRDKSFPGKAIDLLDHACAHEKIDPASDKIVTPEEVAMIIAKVAQVPITQVLGGKTDELTLLAKRLKQRVIGQEDAIRSLVDVIHMTKMGMFIDINKPEGVLLFVGPAGVGKNELARSLTMALLGDEMRLIKFDMTEFKDAASINRLLGAPPGYIGHEQESRLVSCIRSNPNSIIVMDDIEKAHPDVLAVLKQIFEKGVMTTQDGESVYFSYATFILISNIGAEVLKENELKKLGYEELCGKVRAELEDAVKRIFPGNFLNAIDKVVYFTPLKQEWLKQIVKGKIRMVLKRLEDRGFKVKVSEAIEDLLLEKGYSIRFGARYMNKIIENNLLKPLIEYLLSCDEKNIVVSLEANKKLSFKCK